LRKEDGIKGDPAPLSTLLGGLGRTGRLQMSEENLGESAMGGNLKVSGKTASNDGRGGGAA